MKPTIAALGIAGSLALGGVAVEEAPLARNVELVVERKEINLGRLERDILMRTGWQHQSKNNGVGYSGLVLDQIEEDGVQKTRLQVIWTDDGVNGYPIDDFTLGEKRLLDSALQRHE